MSDPRGVKDLHVTYKRETGKDPWTDIANLPFSDAIQEEIPRLDYVVWLEDRLMRRGRQL